MKNSNYSVQVEAFTAKTVRKSFSNAKSHRRSRFGMDLKNRRKLNNRGMGTVEMILIIVVLIGLVLIFKTQIMDLVGNVFDKIAVDSSAILS